MTRSPVEEQKKRKLLEIFSSFFLVILHLRSTNELGDASALRQKIKGHLDQCDQLAGKYGFPRDAVHNAKFALIAFLDEAIITSDWVHKEKWLSFPLQLELFNINDAGEKFFDLLDTLRQFPKSGSDLLEIYYLCLALGFKGKYQIYEQDKLRKLIEELHLELTHLNSRAFEGISPHGLPKEDIGDIVKKEIPLWVFCVAATLISFFVFLIFFKSINVADDHTALFIQQLL
jgi:type VI secretion system protein ImpK